MGPLKESPEVNGHIYVSQTGVGLEELEGDELRPALGGEALRDSTRVYMHAWDERHALIERLGANSFDYMTARRFRRFAPRRMMITSGATSPTILIPLVGRRILRDYYSWAVR